jgi:hypothetical protein
MHIIALDSELDLASPPEAAEMHGTGMLRCEQQEALADITLMFVPGRTTAFRCVVDQPGASIVQFVFSAPPGKHYSLHGAVEGRSFWCNQLVSRVSRWEMTSGGGLWHLVLTPDTRSRIVFDDSNMLDVPVGRVQFALMTYLGPGLDITVDGWPYYLIGPRHSGSVSDWAWAWGSPVESALLLVMPDRPTPLEQVIARTDDFLWLLSMYEGDIISYHRYELVMPDGKCAEVWDPSRRVESPLPANDMSIGMHSQYFLPEAMATYSSLSESGRNLLGMAIGYHLDAKRDQCLHTAFVSEAIAWEMLISERIKKVNRRFPVPVGQLRDRVRRVVDRWADKYSEFGDRNGYRDRVLGSLAWKHLREGVTQLMSELGLDEFVAGKSIDPILLKRMRDKIMHTGDLPGEHQDFEKSLHILQLMLGIGDLILGRILYPDLPLE